MTRTISATHPQASGHSALVQATADDPAVGSGHAPGDDRPTEEILTFISDLPMVTRLDRSYRRVAPVESAARILRWLRQHPGATWQERWLSADADAGKGWLKGIAVNDSPGRHFEMTLGLTCLLIARVVQPSYGFLSMVRSPALYSGVREVVQPDLFARLERVGSERGMQPLQLQEGLRAICRVVIHTGKDPDQIAKADLHEHGEYLYAQRTKPRNSRGVHTAWELLAGVGVLPAQSSMRADARAGQRSVEELVYYYGLRCRPVRDLLVRYLNERSPSLDYGSLRGLAATLAGRFWADIEDHHPDLATLKLPPDVAEGWKQRLHYYTASDGSSRQRKDYLANLARVRTFYLDLQEWALEDPTWAEWAVASPVRRSELHGMGKQRRRTIAAMHQRVRERLPHLATLADSADKYRTDQAELLAAARLVPIGETLMHGGVTYRRKAYKSHARKAGLQVQSKVLVEDTTNGDQHDLSETEDDAFWTWAIIETLRHTGVRAEELLEVTQLAIVSYRLTDSSEIVPLLQIAPSKSDRERLLLISPELASVLASVVKRLRDSNHGTVPLVARYDHVEKLTGPPLPHLFQRKLGTQPAVISPAQLKRMLIDAIARAGITDAAGDPLTYTPHDFRRIFTTEAVTGGLPVHIAAKLLGHQSLDTVDSYMAVFQEELIRSYRSFLDRRRALRPESEYRDPTEEEWREFEEHFHQRKLGLGTCGRPYATPCQHEHACIRCPMLRVDPAQRDRLAEIVRNLSDRIAEARLNGWLGEVEGLTVSLNAATAKLVALDRSSSRGREDNGPVNLGLPVLVKPATTQATSKPTAKPRSKAAKQR